MNSNAPDPPVYALLAIAAIATTISAVSIRSLIREYLEERRHALPRARMKLL